MKSIKRMILMGVAIMALMSFAVPAMAQVKGSPGTTYSGTDARAWGNNSLDELGDGTTTQRNTSVAVKIMNGVSVISGGGSQSLAIKTDGTVFAWGSSWAGQLGDGTTTNRTAPVQVSELSWVKAIAAGSAHSLALKTDGTTQAWGGNAEGELGDGSTTNRYTPVAVSNLGKVKTLAAGQYHSLAVVSQDPVLSQ